NRTGFTARSLRPRQTPLTSTDAVRGAFAGRRRPLCVRGLRVPVPLKSTDGTRTARAGAVTLTVRPALGFDLAFHDSRLIIVALVAGLGLGGRQSRDPHAPLDPAQQPRFPVRRPVERIIVERESFLLNLPRCPVLG